MSAPRLWEVKHPYYCSDTNYYVSGLENPPGGHHEFGSWAEFDWKDSDADLNLLVRWDWMVPDPADYGDEPVPGERLHLYWLLQRKGNFMVTSFPVQRDEEPEIRAWLAERAKTIAAIWAPVAVVDPDVERAAYVAGYREGYDDAHRGRAAAPEVDYARWVDAGRPEAPS